MPPKLKLLPPKPLHMPLREVKSDDALTIGNLRVDARGVVFTGEGDWQVMCTNLQLDKLRRVRQLGSGTQGSVAMYVVNDDDDDDGDGNNNDEGEAVAMDGECRAHGRGGACSDEAGGGQSSSSSSGGGGGNATADCRRVSCEHCYSRVFAVKKIAIPYTADTRLRQTVAAELRNIFSDRGNDYTVQLYNAFYRDGVLRLVMEYMDCGNLHELVQSGARVPEAACAYIASQMLHALQILHTKSNIVTEPNQTKSLRQIHRDIKPANVLLSMDGRVKLADFGIATSAETIGVNSFVGTTTYMSPERIRGQRYSTPSDIWSVGVVILQVMLGHYPFTTTQSNFMALLHVITSIESYPLCAQTGCSAAAQTFIDRCLCQDPDARATASELLELPWIVRHERTGRDALVRLLATLGSVHRGDGGGKASSKRDDRCHDGDEATSTRAAIATAEATAS